MTHQIATKQGFAVKGGNFYAEVSTDQSRAQGRIVHRTERHATSEQAQAAAQAWVAQQA